jgi:hypothetical protein
MSSSEEDGSFATERGRRKVEEDSDISSDSVYEDDTSDDDDSLRIGDSDEDVDAEDNGCDQHDKEGQEDEDGDDDDNDDDDNDDDDDEPLAAKAVSKPAHDPRRLPPSSSSRPLLKPNQDRALAAPILNGNDDEDDSEDDDLPLAAQMKSPSPDHRRANVKKEIKQVVKKEAKNGVTQGGKKVTSGAVKKKVLKKESKGKGKPEPMIKKVERKPRAKKEVNADDLAPNRKFEHPGQRRETPGVNDPLRLFYESMYHERIKLKKPSVLAETWMMHNGLLSLGASAKAFAARRK